MILECDTVMKQESAFQFIERIGMFMEPKTNQGDEFYPFTNQFTFSMVMRDPAICKGLLDRILPDVGFGEVRNVNDSTDEEIIQTMKSLLLSVETEKTLEFDPSAHGVRFDALVNDTKKWAEIEMQTYAEEHIGKRSRYYLSNVDMDAFAKGKPYRELPPTYVIFICTFDYMGEGKPVYFFQHYDVKNDLPLDDEAYIIILNTKCNPGLVPDPLKPLYAYINDPSRVEDEFIQQIEERVQQYNSRKWRSVQVTLEEMLKYEVQRERAKGRAEGRAEGEERLAKLCDLLLKQNRMEDMKRAMRDPEYRGQLFEEYGLL